MATHLVATKVSGSTTAKSTHKPSVPLLLHRWVTGAVLLLSGLDVRVLALWVLILAVGALLRELVLRLRAGVASLLMRLIILPLLLLVVITVLAYLLLTMLKSTLRRGAVLRVVALLFAIALLAVLLLRLLVTLLLIATLVIAALLGVGAVALGRVLLLLAVALVVLIVARHVDVFQR